MPRPPIRNRPSSSMTSERPAHLPHPSAPFHPLADTTTYKDLLLFEERLKMNAQMLNRRRRRYEGQLCFRSLLCGYELCREKRKGWFGLTIWSVIFGDGEPLAFLVTLVISIIFLAHRAMFKPSEVSYLPSPTMPLLLLDIIDTMRAYTSSTRPFLHPAAPPRPIPNKRPPSSSPRHPSPLLRIRDVPRTDSLREQVRAAREQGVEGDQYAPEYEEGL
jgi:hypothetical protein